MSNPKIAEVVREARAFIRSEDGKKKYDERRRLAINYEKNLALTPQ